MYEGVGKAVDGMFRALVFLIVVAVPLALWKLVDIAIWIWKHVHVSIGVSQ